MISPFLRRLTKGSVVVVVLDVVVVVVVVVVDDVVDVLVVAVVEVVVVVVLVVLVVLVVVVVVLHAGIMIVLFWGTDKALKGSAGSKVKGEMFLAWSSAMSAKW